MAGGVTQEQAEPLGFHVENFDWDEYLKYRPAYPASWYNRLFTFHATSGNNSWKLAHDIGAGPGFVAARLGQHFERVAVSDPNSEYLSVAEKGLLGRDGRPSSKFFFGQKKAEDSWLLDGTVDFACMNSMLHWTNPPVALATAARSLKPGGTLAISSYSHPVMLATPRAERIWTSLFEIVQDAFLLDVDPKMAHLKQRALELVYTWMDPVEFESRYWRDGVQRIKINEKTEDGRDLMVLSGKHSGKLTWSKSGRKESDVVIHVPASDSDQEGACEGRDWELEVDNEWCRGLIKTYGLNLAEIQRRAGGLWDDLEKAITEAGGKVTMKWAVVVILATRK